MSDEMMEALIPAGGEVSYDDDGDGPFIATAIALDDDDYQAAPPPPKKRKLSRKRSKTKVAKHDQVLTSAAVESRLRSLSDLRLATSLLVPHLDHHWEVLKYHFHMKSPVDGIAAVIAQTRWVYWGLWENDLFMYRSFQRFSEVRDFLVEYPKLWPTIVKARVLDPKVLKPKRSVDDFNRSNFTSTGVTRHTRKTRNHPSISVNPDWSASSLTHIQPPPAPIPTSTPFKSSSSTTVETLSLFPPQPYHPPPSQSYQHPHSPPNSVMLGNQNQTSYFAGAPPLPYNHLSDPSFSHMTIPAGSRVSPQNTGDSGTAGGGEIMMPISPLKRPRSMPKQTTGLSNEPTAQPSPPPKQSESEKESESSVTSSLASSKKSPAGEGDPQTKKKKKRAPFRRSQLLLLEGSFEESPFSTKAEMDRLVLETGLLRAQIIMWFANRRRQRNKRQGVPRFQWSK
eukprot:TRINITY_DN2741_c1_g2_i1.p1 TRINITY_DN2741_c1_g2~~TRINITY_DN2741_c1_g2_i1.p1  ORF type:complete len:453 (-),score=35.55 TRINITY_DN2741_c1_g2_i1:181-1539(-)